MSKNPVACSVQILDKEYKVACPADERDGLLAAGRFLDERMREIRNAGRVIGIERIAVMAALNIAHELLQQRHAEDHSVQAISQRIRTLQEKIEIALNSTSQLEL